MNQVFQNLRSGELRLAETPAPLVRPGHLLIRTRASLISAGTERMLVEFGNASLVAKARQNPDKVRMVLDKIRADGLAPAMEAVRAKLDNEIPLGYSNAGIVLATGPGVEGFASGDRVVSNGPHAEIVQVPKHLCALIPASVSDEDAAFTVIGAIALQGVRLAQPTLGEGFVVTGLGLVGLAAVQLLRANGCRVLGIDPDPARLALARRFGASTVDLRAGEDPLAAASQFSGGRGVDGVLITAATASHEPVHQAALMCRKRGRLVLVGVAGLHLDRSDFYAKELSFQVSCSYGPGRYDPSYEEQGHDYPLGFVRWTEQRNFEAVLQLIEDRRLDLAPLVSHRYPLAETAQAYAVLQGKEPSLGILLQYPDATQSPDAVLRQTAVALSPPRATASPVVAGFLGAGNYASRVLLPALQAAGVRLKTIASRSGASAAQVGKKFGFETCSSDNAAVLEDPAIDAVFIATRHDSHAALVCQALQAGKHVFVEKPLALNAGQIDQVENTMSALPEPRLLAVGFNRRYAPHIVRMRELLRSVKQPKAFIYTVNAGSVPPDHWTQDPGTGGGRILGEACHFIDLLRFLAGCPATGVHATRQSSDTVTIAIRYEDGSTGTVHYFANGHKSFPKERLEVFAAGRVLALDNFRKLQGYGWPGFRSMNVWRQNKGASAMVAAFLQAIRDGGPSPTPLDETLEVSRVTLRAAL